MSSTGSTSLTVSAAVAVAFETPKVGGVYIPFIGGTRAPFTGGTRVPFIGGTEEQLLSTTIRIVNLDQQQLKSAEGGNYMTM